MISNTKVYNLFTPTRMRTFDEILFLNLNLQTIHVNLSCRHTYGIQDGIANKLRGKSIRQWSLLTVFNSLTNLEEKEELIEHNKQNFDIKRVDILML